LVQGQGGREIQTGGASEANALRGKYWCISRIWPALQLAAFLTGAICSPILRPTPRLGQKTLF